MNEDLAGTGADGVNGFGRYRLIAGLGHGGMAAVHLAVMQGPLGFNKLVVVKEILPRFADDQDILGMFLDEARLAARLSHPNVVQTNEVGVEGKHHFLAMEYLDGQPLSRVLPRLARHGGLPLVMHLQLIADLLGGLHYAHELQDYDGTHLGVVHCDVSPQNTFITYDGAVKVLDFGVAKARTALTQTPVGVIKGKLAYMSPEQVRGDELDRRADVFAAGVMLWEAATGTRPWRGASDFTIATSLLAGHFPAPSASNAGVSVELEAIILKALSFSPRDRHATAAELQAAIEAHVQTLGGRLPPSELGKLVSSRFAPERAVITAVIEEQLDLCKILSSDAALPIPSLASSPAEGDTPRDPDASLARTLLSVRANLHSAITVADSVRRADAGDVRESRSARDLRDAGDVRDERDEREIPKLAVPALDPAARPDLRSPDTTHSVVFGGAPAARRTPRISGGASALLLAAVAITAMDFLPRSARSPALAAPQPATSVTPAAPVSRTIELQVAATPAQARFFLDEVPLAGNPFRGDFPRDASVHHIRIEAPGFVTMTQTLSLDRDRGLEVVLVADAVAAPGRRAPPVDAERDPIGVSRPPRAPKILRW